MAEVVTAMETSAVAMEITTSEVEMAMEIWAVEMGTTTLAI